MFIAMFSIPSIWVFIEKFGVETGFIRALLLQSSQEPPEDLVHRDEHASPARGAAKLRGKGGPLGQ